jgi:hypothetical protein
MWRFDHSSHYSPAEEAEIFENWGNALVKTDSELAEDIVRNIVESERSHCLNSDACGNHVVFRGAPVDKPTEI